jgi:hypothetical protein
MLQGITGHPQGRSGAWIAGPARNDSLRGRNDKVRGGTLSAMTYNMAYVWQRS